MKQEYLDILGIDSEDELDNVNWECISIYQILSEDFIREFKDYVYWKYISIHQKLSENLIREFKDKVDWVHISIYQTLSENFIREFKNEVEWLYISRYQKLSENFIREFKNYVGWYYISINKKLSEDFIHEFKNYVDWINISKYQKLSECFIREFQKRFNLKYIHQYQKLSEDFIQEFEINVDKENNWLYWSKENKLQAIKNCGLYEIDGDYIIAYKSTKTNGFSVYNAQYKYVVGKIYESYCDCNINDENSFGLSAWTKEQALNYYPHGELYKVKIHIDDIGALVKDGNKLRCFKIEILERIQ